MLQNNKKKIGTELEIDQLFLRRHKIRKNRHFDTNHMDVSKITLQYADESFRVNYFVCVLDHAIASLFTNMKI